jgi:glycosyltransferase 2 family protein
VTKFFASRVVRLAVAAGLTGIILWKSDPAAIARLALAASPSWLLWACALVFFDRALMAWRWLLLLRPLTAEAPPPFGAVMRVFFVSTFVGTALPSVGGDAVRAFSLRRHSVPGATAVASVAMDRALGVVAILLLGLASLAAFAAPVPRGVFVILLLGGLASVGLALVIFSDAVASLAANVVALLPGAWVRRVSHSLLDAVRAYRHHHGILATVTAASIGVQILRVLQAWCLGRALGIELALTTYFVSIPVILLIMLLPITINGLGTGQAAFLWTFGAAGVGRPEAFALSILFIALGIVGNLPGALLYLAGGDDPASPAVRPATKSPIS